MDDSHEDDEWLDRINTPLASPPNPRSAEPGGRSGQPATDANAGVNHRPGAVVDLDSDDEDQDEAPEPVKKQVLPPVTTAPAKDAHPPATDAGTGSAAATSDADAADPDDDPHTPDDDDDDDGEPKVRRFNTRVAAAFGTAVTAAVLITAIGTSMLGAPDPPAPTQSTRTSMVAHPVSPAPPSTSGQPEAADQPLPFTAAADCPAGSTTAQSIADPDKPTPWICIRHTDGQPLTITLGPSGMEHSYVITAVSIVPGDITPAQGSATEPWLQHRVVTRLQWQFNDTAGTVLSQSTGNIHGEAVLPVPRINASRITVLIQETSRPPAQAAPTEGPQAAPSGQIFSDILGSPASGGSPQPSLPVGDGPDPSDTTFAVTSIKIIGHKAL